MKPCQMGVHDISYNVRNYDDSPYTVHDFISLKLYFAHSDDGYKWLISDI